MNKKIKVRFIVLTLCGIIAIVVAFVLISKSFSDIKERFVFSVDGYSLKNKPLTIGEKSDVCFNKIAKDFITVEYNGADRLFEWKIKEDADTLYYFKINDDNPNVYDISEGSTVKVEFNGDTKTIVCDSVFNIYRDLWNNRCKIEKIEGKNGQQYLPLSLVLKRIYGNDPVCEHYCGNSFFYCKPRGRFIKDIGVVQLCILDKYTTLCNPDGTLCKYCYKGDVQLSDSVDAMKIQFFSVQDGHYKKEKADDEIFAYNGVNYTMKPVVITTEWGAGHVMLRPTEDSVRVLFQKPIMYAVSLDTLRAWSESTAGQVAFCQNRNLFPRQNNIYFMPFSKALPAEICTLVLDEDSLKIKSLNGDSVMITRCEKGWEPIAMKKIGLKTSGGIINARAEILDGTVIWSYLENPFYLCLLIALFIFLFTNYIPIKQEWINRGGGLKLLKLLFKGLNTSQNISKQTKWTCLYLILLLMLLFGYCCVKMMIGVKLSYTYPYFEKIINILPATISMSLVMFYFVIMLINAKLFFVSQDLNGDSVIGFVRWVFVLISGCILLFCAYNKVPQIDSGNAASVIASYFQKEISWKPFGNPFEWAKNDALNDTHRTILHMQYLASFILFCIAIIYGFILLLKNKKDDVKKESDKNFFVKSVKWLEKFVKNDILIIVLGCIVIFVGFMVGNFGTAFITIGFVMSSSAVINLGWKEWKIKPMMRLLVIMILCVALFVFSFLSDSGYITNCLVLFTPVIFWCLWQFGYEKNVVKGSSGEKQRNGLRIMLIGIVFLFVIGVIIIPRTLSSGVDYGRTDRRLSLWMDYDMVKEKGYRYSENDAEFVSIMTKYMMSDGDTICEDPLDGYTHFLHPSVSSGQSPVILNDLSAPAAFFSAYGSKAYWICWLLIVAMIAIVIAYTFYMEDGHAFLSVQMIWRISALLMWISVTCYLFLSYIGVLPFTGRLIPGFGVDSVGEALEIVFLFGFMASSSIIFVNENGSEEWGL